MFVFVRGSAARGMLAMKLLFAVILGIGGCSQTSAALSFEGTLRSRERVSRSASPDPNARWRVKSTLPDSETAPSGAEAQVQAQQKSRGGEVSADVAPKTGAVYVPGTMTPPSPGGISDVPTEAANNVGVSPLLAKGRFSQVLPPPFSLPDPPLPAPLAVAPAPPPVP